MKTCLIDSHRTTATTEYSDPYFDENQYSQASSRIDHSTHSMVTSVPAPALGKNIMRNHKERNPYEVFEQAKLLGSGSMGTVSMVKKVKDAVGGSARVKNLSTKTRLEMHGVHPIAIKICTTPIVGEFFETCTGLKEYTEQYPCNDSNLPNRDMNGLSEKANSFFNKLGRVGSFGKLVALNISTHQPNHIRINKLLKKERASGNYEPYYALKSIHLDRVNDLTFVGELKNEIAIMKRLDHAHIARLIETYNHKGNIYLVLELCSGGDLYTRDPYTEDQSSRIVSSIMSAVSFMHEHDIMHRDLKYENIMFANTNPKAEVKIIDFGLSKKYLPHESLKEGVGTVYTMSPQVLEGDYTNKADVWAVGVLTYMLLSSQMPFYGKNRRDILQKILKCDYDFKGRRWGQVTKQGKNFVSDLLQYDPGHRPSAEEAKQSIWLNMELTSSIRTANAEDMEQVANSIEKFSTHQTLKKLGLMIIAHKSPSEEISRLRKAFKKYDKKKSGFIKLEDFNSCLKVYGWNDEYIEHLFHCADLDGTGKLKYTEFLAATIETTGMVTEERIAEAFDRLDSDDSGYISYENLRELFGDDVPKEYIAQVIDEVDMKEDHKISYDQFLAMWEGELEENEIENMAGITRRRTVSVLADDIYNSTDDETSTANSGSVVNMD